MFKKKSLKFTYEKVSRDLRHAQAVKARETSRFKRLSIVRSINDSDFLEKSMETPKENKFKEAAVKKETTQKPSRLEMLFKWKQEKQIKKEMEKVSKQKPFYTGGNKSVLENKALQSSKSSSTSSSTTSSFNSSKFAKSKLVTPCTTAQPSRIQNSRQITPSSAIQSSKAKQGAPISTFQSFKNAISKKFTPAASPSKIPHPKQISSTIQPSKIKQTTLPKSGTNLSRSNSIATLSRKFPASAADKTSTSAKVTVSRSNSTAAAPRKFPVPSSKTDNVVSSKATVQRVPLVKRTPHVPISGTALKSTNLSKSANKGLLEPRTLPKCQEEKSIKKAGTGLPKLASNATTVSKRIPVQDKMPVSNMTKKFGSNLKLNQKEASQSKENISARKGYCFRTAVENSSHQKADILLKTSVQGTPKKLPEKISKNIQEKPSTVEFYEQSLDSSIPDVTFNSDLSIIKPARTSFAPSNFAFQAPEGLNNFIFDDDYDVYQDLEEVKRKFMSRTSTPSRSSGGKSSIKSSKESLESNSVADVEKTSDLSNSYDIRISELMTPTSFEVKIDNKEADELVNKQTCNKVSCGIITNIEIKNANMGIDHQPSVKEADIAVNQEACQELDSVSPVKTQFKADKTVNQQTSEEITSDINTDLNQEAPEKLASVSPVKVIVTADKTVNQQTCEEMTSDINTDLNQEAHEELTSISPVKVVVTADSTENAVKNVDSALQKSLFSEKQSFDDYDVTENTIEKGNSENHFNQSVKNGTPEKTDEGVLFLQDDESLLDSIDLSKIMINSEDEDSEEDDVPSPQIPNYSEKKSNGAFPKRVSMLKRLSVMKSIAETNENECVSKNLAKSSNSQDTKVTTPRRSKRVSNLVPVDSLSYSPMKNSADSPNITPRRSLRLMKISSANDNNSVSPFQEKNINVNSRRRSVRLIDLNTPEKVACEKLLGENFENLDPNNFLIDFESPTMLPKSKKVSLLYSPERRKSIRKSIKGDLMSFSPV